MLALSAAFLLFFMGRNPMSSGRKLASKGGPTSTGGVILEGNENLRIEGKIIASIGQLASCPACSAGQGPIVAVGERTLILPASPAISPAAARPWPTNCSLSNTAASPALAVQLPSIWALRLPPRLHVAICKSSSNAWTTPRNQDLPTDSKTRKKQPSCKTSPVMQQAKAANTLWKAIRITTLCWSVKSPSGRFTLMKNP